MKFAIFMVGAVLAAGLPVAAQDNVGEIHRSPPETDAEWREWIPDPEDVALPQLAFEEREQDTENYQKYFYFNRPATGFAQALADLRQCDNFARGLYGGEYYPEPGAVAMYGIGGVLGGVIGGAIANAIRGSAEERRKRRVNMRRCMFFKGYERYGVSKKLWEKFNFEEGNKTVPEPVRQAKLFQQAKVASGPRPGTKDLGL